MNTLYFDSIALSRHAAPASILIPWPSGVTLQVQCSGIFCQHKEMTGICLPFMGCQELGEALLTLHPGCGVDLFGMIVSEVHAARSLSEREAVDIDNLLSEYDVPLRVDRKWLSDSSEAWIHVIISKNEDPFLQAFNWQDWTLTSPVLTWQNCD